MATKFIVPPKCCIFERNERFLLLDPVNFVWFVTDDKVKTVVEALSREHCREGAVAALAQLVGCEPENGEVAGYVDKCISHLLKIGFLHEGAYKQIHLPVGVAEMPKTLYLHLTSKCNLRCPYCYNQEHRTALIEAGKVHDSPHLSTEGRTEDFLKIVDEAADLGFSQIKLTGGEATLKKDFLLIAKHAKAHGMKVNLLTNGTLITPALAPQIAEVVDSVSISIDSDNPAEHDAVRGRGTHAMAVNAFALLRHAGVGYLHVNAVITPVNVNSVQSFLEYAEDRLKADRVTTAGSEIKLEDTQEDGGGAAYQLTREQHYRVYEQNRDFYQTRGTPERGSYINRGEIFRTQCGAGNGIISIDANGDVYPCQTLHRPEFRCGNAFKSGLRTVLQESEVFQQSRNAVVDLIPECNVCPVRYVCAGGCRSEAYLEAKDFLGRNREMCPTYFATALDRLWNSAAVPVQNAGDASRGAAESHACAD